MAKKDTQKEDAGRELLMALEILEKEKDISKETMKSMLLRLNLMKLI